MPSVTQDFIQSLGLRDDPNLANIDMKLLQRILTIPDIDMANRGRKERTRRVSVVGRYPRYLAHSLNLSDLPKYDPEDRVWRDARSDMSDVHGNRRHDGIPAISDSSRQFEHVSEFGFDGDRVVYKKPRPLRLPPIILPPLYTVKPTPLQPRYFFSTNSPRGPITDEEWEDLKECRYIRPGLKKFKEALVR